VNQMVKSNVLAFCIKKIPSSILGVIEPLTQLDNQNVINFEFIESSFVDKNHIAKADVVICIRGSEELDLKIIRECRRLNKYIIYFMDDDLLNIPSSAGSSAYYNHESIRHNIITLMKESDCLWTTNTNIARKYADLVTKTAVLNAPALHLNKRLYVKEANDPIVIGFAGSLDHAGFLDQLLNKTILNLLEKYPNIKFEFYGAKPSLVDEYKLTHIPYENDYSKYSEVIVSRNWDIGLAPLQDSDFHKSKYFNKYLEYSSKQIVGVYSNIEPYTFIVKNGVNGFLVNNTTDEWTETLSYLIEHKKARNNVITESFRDVQNNFSLSSITEGIKSKIPEIMNYKAPFVKVRQVKDPSYIKSFYFQKIINIIKREKMMTPFFIGKKILVYLKSK